MTSHVHRIEKRSVCEEVAPYRVTFVVSAVCSCGKWQSVPVPVPAEDPAKLAAAISRCAAGARIHRLAAAADEK